MTQQVLAVLLADRRCAIAGDFAFSRRFRLRRRVAAFAYSLADGVRALGAVLDERHA